MRGLRLLTLSAVLWSGALLAADEVVIASYNLENYLGPEDAAQSAGARHARAKSDKSAAAVTRIVHEMAPDILGLCEMGSPQEFHLFQDRLRAAGLHFSESEYVSAIDAERHLALLSRFPIVARHSQPNLTFDLNGAPHKVARGLLDVTIRLNDGYELRLVGVHLKSKLAAPEGEAVIRRQEAALIRRYLERILAAAPETNLLLYGDFNDYRNEVPIQTIAGPRGAADFLAELPAADSAGERWTHYWKPADLYARIDYFFASRALLHEIAPGKTGIYRGEGWFEASGHRPIYTAVIPVNRR